MKLRYATANSSNTSKAAIGNNSLLHVFSRVNTGDFCCGGGAGRGGFDKKVVYGSMTLEVSECKFGQVRFCLIEAPDSITILHVYGDIESAKLLVQKEYGISKNARWEAL